MVPMSSSEKTCEREHASSLQELLLAPTVGVSVKIILSVYLPSAVRRLAL